jgi:hypothetical protein
MVLTPPSLSTIMVIPFIIHVLSHGIAAPLKIILRAMRAHRAHS